MSYKSTRRRRYEDLAWKGTTDDYKARKMGGTKFIYTTMNGISVLAPLHALSNKQLLKLVPRGHLRMLSHHYTKTRRSR